MSYKLSMMSEFWFAEGEPYDRSDLALNAKGQPVSVYSAIEKALENEDFKNDVSQLLKMENLEIFDNGFLADTLINVAIDTNTSTNLDSPVEVWIDEDGLLKVYVYEMERS